MPLSFPSNPTVQQQSTQNGRVYVWTGAAWELATLIATHTHSLSELTQSGATTNQVISWNGTAWAPANAATGSGTVTSVGLALPPIFSITNSPVTGSGTLTGSLATQTANTVFAGPSSGAAAAPTFRALAIGDTTGLQAALDSKLNASTYLPPAIYDLADDSPALQYDSSADGWVVENPSGLRTAISAVSTNDARLSDSRTPTSHTHGNLTNAGAIGSTSGAIVVTTTSGVLTTATIGSGLTLSGGTLTASGGGSSTGSDLYLWATFR